MEEFIEEMDDIADHFLNMPPFEILRTYFISPEVCPTALTDNYLVYLIELEQAVTEYNTLPYDGGYWDQPLLMIEAFNAIRSERNQFERVRIETMKAKAKTKGKGGKSGSPNEDRPPRRKNIT